MASASSAAQAPPLIDEVDYGDTFTVGTAARPDGFCCDNSGGAYDLEGNFALGVTDGWWRVNTVNDDPAMLGFLGSEYGFNGISGRGTRPRV